MKAQMSLIACISYSFFFFMNVQQQASAIFNIVQLYVTKGH